MKPIPLEVTVEGARARETPGLLRPDRQKKESERQHGPLFNLLQRYLSTLHSEYGTIEQLSNLSNGLQNVLNSSFSSLLQTP
jgi:hypothetical protein